MTGVRSLGLVGEADLAWIGALVAVVVRLEGEPWRLALDAIESGEWLREAGDALGEARPSPRRLGATVEALRRMLAAGARNVALARKARALLLGVPALTAEARDARIEAVAADLALAPAELARVLWADLPRERPIELPPAQADHARSTSGLGPREVAALANVGLVQRALRHAHSVELVIRGDAGAILRAAAARGLLVTAAERSSDDKVRETVLDIVGPLALCHGTAVYGRALGTLVPVLGSCADFALTIRAEARGQAYELSVASPALLPTTAAQRSWPLVARLARDLGRLGIVVRAAPPAIAGGGAVVCPDLGVDVGGRTIWIEIVGFWTPAYLARKVARYRAAGAGEVVLCIDATRACDDDNDAPPDGALVVRFERRIHAEALAELLGLGSRGVDGG